MRIKPTGSRLALAGVALCLLLVFVPATRAQFGNEVPPQEIIRLIEEKGRELNFGVPLRSASILPYRRASDLAIYDWSQEYQGGVVFWSAFSRKVQGVTGTIRRKWESLGGYRSELGFPKSDELPSRGADANDRYQLFDRGRIHWVARTNEATAYYEPTNVCEGGLCPASARFRVTLNGFVANRQTQDDPLQRDGKGDEVFFLSSSHLLRKDGVPRRPVLPGLPPDITLGWNAPVRTPLYGDTNGQSNPQRIRAGEASDLGGIVSGNRYPTLTPWQRVGNPSPNRLPLLVWEGALVQGQTGLAIVPTIWEWDNQTELLDVWHSALDYRLNEIGGGLGGLLANPGQAASAPIIRENIGTILGGRPDAFAKFDKTRFDARDRPVGMKEPRGDQYPGQYLFQPKVMLLTYESAQKAVTTSYMWRSQGGSVSLGNGIVAIDYTDDPGLDGSYTLFLQIERVP
jgi:hypothetical protein